MNGLEKITNKILTEAQEEADRILADAAAECDRLHAEYAARAEAVRARLSAEAEQEGTDLIAREKASAVTYKRNVLLEAQSRLLDETFAAALGSVRDADGAKYTETLIGLLCAAFSEQLETERESRALYGEDEVNEPAQYEVLLCRRDLDRYGKDVVEGARKRLGGKVPATALEKLTLSHSTAPIGGGLVLRCGSIESNCSLERIFAQLREELEAEVSRALFDSPARRG